ncbi:hypothetical protein TNCV_1212361 [Trichonephila clavipes]|nr:hypothetical protein TNCV_1212361 [Trichonephila clavipes]
MPLTVSVTPLVWQALQNMPPIPVERATNKRITRVDFINQLAEGGGIVKAPRFSAPVVRWQRAITQKPIPSIIQKGKISAGAGRGLSTGQQWSPQTCNVRKCSFKGTGLFKLQVLLSQIGHCPLFTVNILP